MSPAFHAHLAGEASLPGAARLLAGSDALCFLLAKQLNVAGSLERGAQGVGAIGGGERGAVGDGGLEAGVAACSAEVRAALQALCPAVFTPLATVAVPPSPAAHLTPRADSATHAPSSFAVRSQGQQSHGQGQKGQGQHSQGQGHPSLVLQLPCRPPEEGEEAVSVPSHLLVALVSGFYYWLAYIWQTHIGQTYTWQTYIGQTAHRRLI